MIKPVAEGGGNAVEVILVGRFRDARRASCRAAPWGRGRLAWGRALLSPSGVLPHPPEPSGEGRLHAADGASSRLAGTCRGSHGAARVRWCRLARQHAMADGG